MTPKRSMQTPSELIPPGWLVTLAGRDSPPTSISDEVLRRLSGAGAEEFVPCRDRHVLRVEEVDSANGIGVIGPGLAFAEALQADENTPVAAALERLCGFLEGFDRLRRIRLAAIDMRLVEAAAKALSDECHGNRVLESGMVVTYARPYLSSNRAGGVHRVPGNWNPTESSRRQLHDRLLALRHSYYAHADRTGHRTLTDTTALLSIDGPPIFAEAWTSLRGDELSAIARLARSQAERFEAEATTLGSELGEHHFDSDDLGWNIAGES